MKKKELIAAVASRVGVSQSASQDYLDAVLTEISQALSRGDQVDLSGFGKFEVRHRAARSGRNPQTGETIQIAAKNVPAFKASKALKETV